MGKAINFVIFIMFFAVESFSQQKQELSHSFDTVEWKTVSLNGQTYYKFSEGGEFIRSSVVGHPDLPYYNYTSEIPDCDSVIIQEKLVVADTVDLKDYYIVPKQKVHVKTDSSERFVMDYRTYFTDSFGQDSHVRIIKKGKLLKKALAVISVAPVRYNPVQNKLERVKHIEYEVVFVNAKAKEFPQGNVNKNQPYRYIIVSDTLFRNTLQPFIKWKRQQGFNITEAYTQEIGHSAKEIYDYLYTQYTEATPLNPAQDYLLIVGDTSYVPVYTGNYVIDNYPQHFTDFYYTDYTDDMFPDVLTGRMSVSDTVMLKNVLDKTVKYESFMLDSADYLNKTLLVAGKETGHHAPDYTNSQVDYLKDYFSSVTDTSVYYNPYSAEAKNAEEIKEKLNSGNGWVIYTGHGSRLGWQNPAFKVSDVMQSVNYGKYGIYVTNSCHAGKFYSSENFTSSVITAENKGGVASIGACDYTTWEDDFSWSVGAKYLTFGHAVNYDKNKLGPYDVLFRLRENFKEDCFFTVSHLLTAGNMAVVQSNSDYINYYWEVYNLQGDPSLIPYAGMPSEIKADIPKSIPVTYARLEFITEPYTYVALSDKNRLISVCRADSLGKAELDMSDYGEKEKELIIVQTKQFYKTRIDTVTVSADNIPFITIKDVVIKNADTSVPAELLEEGVRYNLSFTVKNTGKKDIKSRYNTKNVIELQSENLIFTDNILEFSDLKVQDSIKFDAMLPFAVKKGVKDLTVDSLVFNISYSDNEYKQRHAEVKEISAPVLDIISVSLHCVSDTVKVEVDLKNSGHKHSERGYIVLRNLYNAYYAGDSLFYVESLKRLDTAHVGFLLKRDNIQNDTLAFTLAYITEYYNMIKDYSVDFHNYVETFEDGLSVYNWHNDGDYPWETDDSISYQGQRSLRSNGKLKDNQKSILTIDFNSDVSVNISFYAKVSSELDYDKFKFLIDGKERLVLSGEVDWKEYRFDINSGQHTVIFSYSKDNNYDSGKDAAWIDNFLIRQGSDTVYMSLDGENKDGDIIIYPNPAKDSFKILGKQGKYTAYIYDNRGKLVHLTVQEDDATVRIPDFTSGIYYVILKYDGGKKEYKKVLILNK